MASATIAAGNDPDLGWRDEYRQMVAGCRAPMLRSIAEFAEQELIFPSGPYAGRLFRREYQPFAGLYLDTIAEAHRTRRWNRFFVTGPSQSGKSLLGFVLPCLYHLFELRETVILGLPDGDMALDKFRDDIRPAIEAGAYRSLLPRMGGGSRGGRVQAIAFRNGAVLRFMTGGGGDKARAAFTSRVLVVTETDGFDVIGGTSRESDKFSQLEARTRAFGERKSIYAECTVSLATGRTWREYQAGTNSRIVRPCPYCRAWVTPERRDLQGWQDAESVVEARRLAHFACPECARAWTEEERRAANLKGKLLHRGQSIDAAGGIHGDPPETNTLGFRWSAIDNHLLTAGDVAVDEWVASREENVETVERRLCQFVWATPPAPTAWQEAPVTAEGIIGRAHGWPAKFVPRDAVYLTESWDLHKWTLYWLVVAWFADGRGHVVDYGKAKTEADMLGTEKAVYAAMEQLAELTMAGWTWEEHANPRVPDQCWIDSGYLSDVVYAFCRGQSDRFRPTKGYGSGQLRRQRYNRPRQINQTVVHLGTDWHVSMIVDKGVFLVEIDANAWKSWVHNRLTVPIGQPGALTLYKAPPREHLDFARQVCAEKQEETFVEGRGLQRTWTQTRSNNHWLDCLYLNSAAANFCGLQLLPEKRPPAPPPAKPKKRVTMPDGRPYLITER
jgi:phage terminase large subunit GpA-like protein